MFYHVSPRKNRGSILVSGIEPIFATGKEQKVWLVETARLMWAIAHCSARHHIPVNELDIWKVTYVTRVKRTAWQGVFSTTCRVVPFDFELAEKFVEQPR